MRLKPFKGAIQHLPNHIEQRASGNLIRNDFAVVEIQNGRQVAA